MIFVASTALGLAFYRVYVRIEEYHLHDPAILDTTPVVAMWTFALVILRLQQPRPRLRRLFRQSGMAACSTSAFLMIVYLPIRLLGLMKSSVGTEFEGGFRVWDGTIFGELLHIVGIAVAAVWLNLALSGRWLAEKSWIDRLGRLFALYWMAIAAIYVWRI